MALARKNLQGSVSLGGAMSQTLVRYWNSETQPLLRRRRWVSTEVAAVDHKSEGKEIAVYKQQSKKFRLFPTRRRPVWRNTNRDDSVPALWEFHPSGLGDALLQSSQNVARLFESLTPAGLTGRIEVLDEVYKLRFDVRGVGEEDLKVGVDDGIILTIKGEDVPDGDNNDGYPPSRYDDYYKANLVLPEDAKADQIKAQRKSGVLTITIPRSTAGRLIQEG